MSSRSSVLGKTSSKLKLGKASRPVSAVNTNPKKKKEIPKTKKIDTKALKKKVEDLDLLELSIKKDGTQKRSLSRNHRSKTVLSEKSSRKEPP